MLDLAKGLSGMVLKNGVLFTSVEMSFSFLEPATVNELLDIHTEVQKKGKEMVFTSATILNENGVVITTAKQTGKVVMDINDHIRQKYGIEVDS